MEADRAVEEEAVALKAVIFDLWDTLVLWPGDAFEKTKLALAEHIPDFERVWDSSYGGRQHGRIDDYFRNLGLDEPAVAACVRIRTEFTRANLLPRAGAAEALVELERRGLKRGLISVCSSEVSDAWNEFPLAELLDDVVLSCDVGLSKPDPAIYRLACERLGVEPGECMFVGDGANDELAGAARLGMRAVCILPPGRSEALWPEARGWEPTIASLPDVLSLV
ncbi:MAG: HAD family hydrolase [Gaiellaceae bacterium]